MFRLWLGSQCRSLYPRRREWRSGRIGGDLERLRHVSLRSGVLPCVPKDLSCVPHGGRWEHEVIS